MHFWARRTAGADRPSDRRSLRSRAVTAQVDRFATTAPIAVRRRLRHAFERVLDELPAPNEHSMDVLREALELGASAGQTATSEQRDRAATAFRVLELRLLALRHLDLVLSTERPAIDTWEWCREVVVTMHGAMTNPSKTADPLTSTETLPDILNGGCSLALQMWGMAIESQEPGRGESLRSPPKLDLAGAHASEAI